MTSAQLSIALSLGFAVFSFFGGFIAAKLQLIVESLDRNADAIDDFRTALNSHANACIDSEGVVRTRDVDRAAVYVKHLGKGMVVACGTVHAGPDGRPIQCELPSGHEGDHRLANVRWSR